MIIATNAKVNIVEVYENYEHTYKICRLKRI